jgi:hypothetical protein
MSWRSSRGRVLAYLVIAVLLGRRAIAAPSASFSTPEAAVQHFVKRLAADDLDGAMQAFRIDELCARIDASVQAQRKDRSAHAKSRTLIAVAKINVAAQIASDTRRFVYALLLDGTEDQAMEASDANIDRFIRTVDPARLKAMRVVRIDQPIPSTMNQPDAIQLAKQQAARLGSDERTERIALFQLDGTYYRTGFTLLRDGGSWRIAQLQSLYGNVEMTGRPARKTTVEDYEALTK